MRLTLLLVLSCLILATFAAKINVRRCTGTGEMAFLKSVDVSPCKGAPGSCALVRGTSASIAITFKTKEAISKVQAVVHGKLGPLTMPFPLKNPDGCLDSGLTCPLATDRTYTYTTKLNILKSFPKVSVSIKWELLDQNGKDIACLWIKAHLV